jgi:hypothetical protein
MRAEFAVDFALFFLYIMANGGDNVKRSACHIRDHAMRHVIVILAVLLLTGHLQGDELKKRPGWAIVSSVVLPGGGQFYAENYARGIFFSTLQIGLLSMTVYEKVQERDYKKLYDEDHSGTMWDEYNKHKGRVRNLLWWDAGIWFLACADAFTDAHFYGFGEEERASFLLYKEREGIGVRMTLKF